MDVDSAGLLVLDIERNSSFEPEILYSTVIAVFLEIWQLASVTF